jgi:hypothetical protein
LFIKAEHPPNPDTGFETMRKTIVALALAAAALAAGTSASQAHYYHGYGYNSYGYNSYGYNSYSYSYQPTYYCHTITYSVWDDYSCSYVYRTKEVCG